ncbi:hypothetical protein GGR52DRAFT_573215 [Hypoxylon sp. FL1284]|nr:hypothetical protein GGR52DRAFT_573215 [Hypoxylon sp. FL1284]
MLLFASNIELALSNDIAYCASINTASTNANSSIYQSNGLCTGFCSSDYAFSVLQDDSCWCTNYIPDKTTQVGADKCDTDCHGYPSDKCGGNGLWEYIALDMEPSGTLGGSSSKTPAPESPDQSPTATPSPSTQVHTVTAGGTVSLQTVTVIPTVPAGADAAASADAGMTSSHQGLSTGQAVGVAIGVLGAVAIAIAAGVFFYFRRRRQAQAGMMENADGSRRGSSADMMSTPTTAMASVWDGDNTSTGRRNSRFMPHDPRMDPYTTNIYSRFENKSHESINTLQDNHDYSRKVLRTTNPDPVDAE